MIGIITSYDPPRKSRLLQALVEISAEAQALKAAWQSHLLEALIEIFSEGQAL